MVNTYVVHFPDGNTRVIECQPYEIKKKVFQELVQIPFDQLVLINQSNGQILNSFDSFNYRNIVLQAMDLNVLLKENLMLKVQKENYSKKIELLEKEIEQWRCDREQYLQRIKEHEQEYQERETILNDSEAELSSLKKKLNETQQQLQNKLSDLDLLRNQFQDSNQKNQEYQENLKNYKVSTEKKDENILQLKNIVQNLQQQLDQQTHSYTQQMEAMKHYCIQLQMQRQQVQEENQAQINEKSELIRNLEKQIRSKKIGFDELDEAYQATKANLSKELIEKKRLTTKLKDLEVRCSELEESIGNPQRTPEDQSLIQQLKKDVKQQQQTNQDMKLQYEQSIDKEIQQLNNFYQNKIKEYQQEIENKQKEIEKYRLDFQNQLKQEQEKIRNLQSEKYQNEREISNLQIQIENLKQNLEDKNKNNQSINSEIEFQKQQYTKLQEQNQEQLQIIQQMKSKIVELDFQNLQLQHQLQDKEIAYNGLNKYLDEQKCQIEQEGRTIRDYEIKLKIFSQRFEEVQRIENYSSPMEALMKTEFKINKFFEDPNSQLDEQKYTLYEVDYDENKFSKCIQEEQYFSLNTCFKYQHLGSIQCTRSIQPNVQTELLKCYLIKVNTAISAKDLKDKILMRKDLKFSNSQCSTLLQAAKNATNNIFTKWLLTKFNKHMFDAKLKIHNNIKIQRQFILENTQKQEFYYCEGVEDGEYQIINGGQFVPQKDDLHQYLNGFSRYSLKYFDNNFLITYLQVCGDYLHDMIVSTQLKGLFSLLDKGQEEIVIFNDVVKKANQKYFIKGWNDILEKYAENKAD